jgi:nucleotide-binding universal stress UspA family protein
MAEVRPETHDRLFAEREALVSTWIGPAVDEGAVVRLVVKDGDPRDSFLTEAENADAGLIVLGRTGQSGGPGFLHLGSVVEHAAHHCRQPLVVVPSAVLRPITRIVVGVDGSKESLAALTWCADLAKVTTASVTVVVVKKPERGWGTRTPVDQWRHDTERQLDEWLGPLGAAGIETDRILQADTHPADGLLGAASAADGDVLVIGTKGAGGISGVRIGGVAMKVLHKASLPLVLVPPPSSA